MKQKQRIVRFISGFTGVVMTVGMVLGNAGFNVSAATGNALDIGSPTFKNTDTLTYYNHGVEYTAGNMLKSIYDSDMSKGGNSFYMDRILERDGVANGDPNSNGNDDGNTFLTRGRALYMYTSDPSVIGFGGNTSYHQPLGKSAMYSISFKDGSTSLSSTEDAAARVNTPSNWTGTYTLGSSNVTAKVSKFISYEDVAVTLVTLENSSDAEKQLTMDVNSGFVKEKSTVKVNGTDQNELTGTFSSPSNLTTITARLTGDGLGYSDASASTLTKNVVIPAKGSIEVKVAMTFSTKELPNSYTDYIRFAGYDNATALKTQKQEYNSWWNENIPYIDVPNKAIQKAIDYRWWLERFNVLDANIPGYDYQYPVTIEGVLGYNNAIALTQPMHLQDTKWMRSAYLPYGQILSVGNSSQSSAFLDNPGNRSNWNNHYGQYIGTAGLEAYNVIGGNADIANTFAYYFEHDAKGQLDHYGNHTSDTTSPAAIISYQSVYMTGNDADTISMHYPGVGTWKAHGENAYVYGAADAASKLYQAAGNTAKATELSTLAGTIQTDILKYLWCNKDNAFETRAVAPTTGFVVHNPDQPNLVKLTESNNFNYFSEYVVPTDAASVDKYGKALEKLKYADEFPIFPYYTADQVDNKLQPGGSNNFSNINFTVQARAYEAALRTYDPTHQYVTPKMLSTMVEWCAWNMYPNAGDVRYPNNNEFFNFDGKTNDNYYRSWIYHNILGNYNYIFVEDMAGLRPRSDNKIELSPINFDYDHFMVNNLRYHGKDVTIVWDKIDGTKNYSNLPEGYSLYIDGNLVLNLDNLATVVYDPATGDVTFPDASSTANVLSKAASSVPAAVDVNLTETRVVDMFKKSGIDLTMSLPNLATGAAITASYTPASARAASWADKHRADGNDTTSKAVNETAPDPNAVVDGVTVNMPFWGNDKSPNASDYLDFDLGSTKTIDMLNIYFYNDRQAGGYTEPAKYNVQYWDGTAWVHAQNQTRTPGVVTANYNNNKFTAFTTNKVRLTFFNKPEHYTAVTEVQLFNEGGARPTVENTAPVVSLKVDDTKKENLKAYMVATCEDDGMPYDSTMSYEWKVIEQPAGSKVLFSNMNSLTPILTASDEGQYKVQLTANDGEKSTTISKVVTITKSLSSNVIGTDVAPLAVPSSDYTCSWEKIARVNDVNYNPESSDPAVSGGKGWGDWKGGQTGSTHYLQYTWTKPVTIYKNDIYWYDDGGGTRVPTNVTFQYLDSKDTWQDAKMLTDFSNANAINQYNTIEIEPITTKSIRMNCVLSADGTGVLRWKAYEGVTLKELLPTFAATKTGVKPTLPDNVYAATEDGNIIKVPVVWDAITDQNVATDGTFTVSGVNKDTGMFTTADVTVRSDMDKATITDVFNTEVSTVEGKAPLLPTTVKVKYNNGAVDNISVPVQWDATAVAAANTAGVHNLTGIGTVTGTSTKANLILNVLAQTVAVDKTALKTQIDAGNALVQSLYTEATWSVFASALSTANTVYNNADATQKMVDDALAALKDAAGKLELKPVVEQVAKPTATPEPGSYTGAQKVTLSTATAGASIYYTVDGSVPTAASTKYSAPIDVAASTVIKAIAVKDGMSNSDVAAHSYTININTNTNTNTDTNGYIPPNPTPAVPVIPVTPATTTTITTSDDGRVIIKSTPKVENGVVVSEITSADIDKALQKAVANSDGMKTVVVEVKDVNNTKKFIQRLPADKVSAIAATASIQIDTPIADMTVPSNMIKQNDAKNSKMVEIVIEASDSTKLKDDIKKQIDSRPVINVYATIDGKKIEWNNPTAPLKVQMDYKPTAKELENTDRIVAYAIDSNNKLIVIPNGRYDKAAGKVSFTTTHLGNYAIAYAEESFSDSAKYAWAQKSIDALTVKGIAEGRTNTQFSPEATVSREEYIAWLVRSLGLTAEVKDNFADVINSKYSEEIAIAKALGIASGTGDNKFQPGQSITRQDLMTLTVKALDIAKKISEKGTQNDIQKFKDASKVSGYAVESVATLVKSGVIAGSGNNINPKGNTTRAEAAVIIYKLYNK